MLQAISAGDRELEVHSLVLEVRVLGVHPELRVGHLNEGLGRERAREAEREENSSDRHGFN